MTECDRLIQNHFISKDFLKEEIREGYLVTEKTKKVWAIELDLLSQISSFCKKNNIRYFLGFGTLLGAVRHKGFIPWDDDLDIWVPREDYDRMVQLAPDYFKAPYFFQTTLNDDDYYSAFARLRNSNTTGILVSGNNKCNNGIYIDIYPLDGHRQNVVVQNIVYQYIHILNIAAHAYTFNINPRLVTRVLSKILRMRFLHYDPKIVYRYVNSIASKIPWKKAQNTGIVVFTPYPYKNNVFPIADFDESIEVPFEHITAAIPAGYDEILKTLYGNYMEFPPLEKRGNWHDFTFEPDIPYSNIRKS